MKNTKPLRVLAIGSVIALILAAVAKLLIPPVGCDPNYVDPNGVQGCAPDASRIITPERGVFAAFIIWTISIVTAYIMYCIRFAKRTNKGPYAWLITALLTVVVTIFTFIAVVMIYGQTLWYLNQT